MSNLVANPNAMKQGDTEPLVLTLSDDNGPVNLAAAAVTFRMASRVPGAGHAPISALATVMQQVDASGRIAFKGMVQYEWGPGETDVVGVYGFDFLVEFSDGTKRSFPNDRTVTLEIEPAP